MSTDNLLDKTTLALKTALNMRQLRHGVISSNIANAETPGYHAKKLDFESALARAVDTENIRHMFSNHGDHFAVGQGAIMNVKADIYENPDVNVNKDGNTVDVEKEMASLVENSLMYKAALKLINKKIANLKYAITEGNR